MKKTLGVSVMVLLTASTLVACGGDAQNGTFPNYGADEAYNLTNPDDFAAFVKEYETLPDNYIEEITHGIDQTLGVTAEPDAIKKAGDLFCESTDFKDVVLATASSLSDDANDVDSEVVKLASRVDQGVLEEEWEAIDEVLGTQVDVMDPDNEESAAVSAYAMLSGLTECQEDFSSKELTGAAVLINKAAGKLDNN